MCAFCVFPCVPLCFVIFSHTQWNDCISLRTTLHHYDGCMDKECEICRDVRVITERSFQRQVEKQASYQIRFRRWFRTAGLTQSAVRVESAIYRLHQYGSTHTCFHASEFRRCAYCCHKVSPVQSSPVKWACPNPSMGSATAVVHVTEYWYACGENVCSCSCSLRLIFCVYWSA